MPKRLPFKEILDHVIDFYKDKDKALMWWMSNNPNLQDKSPFQLAKEGKGHKVMRLIESCGIRHFD